MGPKIIIILSLLLFLNCCASLNFSSGDQFTVSPTAFFANSDGDFAFCNSTGAWLISRRGGADWLSPQQIAGLSSACTSVVSGPLGFSGSGIFSYN